jgi:hypothetical protein
MNRIHPSTQAHNSGDFGSPRTETKLEDAFGKRDGSDRAESKLSWFACKLTNAGLKFRACFLRILHGAKFRARGVAGVTVCYNFDRISWLLLSWKEVTPPRLAEMRYQ